MDFEDSLRAPGDLLCCLWRFSHPFPLWVRDWDSPWEPFFALLWLCLLRQTCGYIKSYTCWDAHRPVSRSRWVFLFIPLLCVVCQHLSTLNKFPSLVAYNTSQSSPRFSVNGEFGNGFIGWFWLGDFPLFICYWLPVQNQKTESAYCPHILRVWRLGNWLAPWEL